MSGWNICYILEKNEVKIAELCLSLKLHLLVGVTCLAPRYNVTLPAWFEFNVNLYSGRRGRWGLSHLHWASSQSLRAACLVTFRSFDKESLRLIFPRVSSKVDQCTWCQSGWSRYIFFLITFWVLEGDAGGVSQNSGRTVAFGWNDLGNGLNPSLNLVSVDKICSYSSGF